VEVSDLRIPKRDMGGPPGLEVRFVVPGRSSCRLDPCFGSSSFPSDVVYVSEDSASASALEGLDRVLRWVVFDLEFAVSFCISSRHTVIFLGVLRLAPEDNLLGFGSGI
jgi:hypothetical protein